MIILKVLNLGLCVLFVCQIVVTNALYMDDEDIEVLENAIRTVNDDEVGDEALIKLAEKFSKKSAKDIGDHELDRRQMDDDTESSAIFRKKSSYAGESSKIKRSKSLRSAENLIDKVESKMAKASDDSGPDIKVQSLQDDEYDYEAYPKTKGLRRLTYSPFFKHNDEVDMDDNTKKPRKANLPALGFELHKKMPEKNDDELDWHLSDSPQKQDESQSKKKDRPIFF